MVSRWVFIVFSLRPHLQPSDMYAASSTVWHSARHLWLVFWRCLGDDDAFLEMNPPYRQPIDSSCVPPSLSTCRFINHAPEASKISSHLEGLEVPLWFESFILLSTSVIIGAGRHRFAIICCTNKILAWMLRNWPKNTIPNKGSYFIKLIVHNRVLQYIILKVHSF